MAPARSTTLGPQGYQTLAELLCYLPTQQMRQQLEEFRVEYEAEHGATDMTRGYTTRWPAEQQQWMLNHSKETREAWLRGAPDFVREFFKDMVNEIIDQRGHGRFEPGATTIQMIREVVGGHTCPPEPDTGRGRG